MFSLEYLAGLIDGEGNIACQPSYKKVNGNYIYYYPRVQITNTCLSLLEDIKNQVGGVISLKQKSLGKKDCYDLRISGDNARNLIKDIIPFLYIKKKIAIDTLLADTKGF